MRLVTARQASVLPALALVLATAATAQTTPVASVRGVVFDSVGMRPLSEAVVRIVRASDPATGLTARTDSTGAFRYDSVPAGVWLATFLHPVLDSLRLEPAIVRLEITEGGTVEMPLVTPSPRTLVRAVCGAAIPDDLGLIVGDVRRADDDAPIANAMVAVEWPEWVLVKRKLTTDQQRATATTDSLGRYFICGAPAGSTLRTLSWAGADSSGLVEVEVPAGGYAAYDFAIGAMRAVASDTLSAKQDVVRRGTAVVRGTVTTAQGAALPNASIRVIGSGTTVRTDTTGAFQITDAGSGTQTIEARAIGYQPVRRTLRLSSVTPTTVALRLQVANVQLDTVRVIAGREIPWDVRGIERRWRTGMGTFLDAKMVKDRAVLYTTDALRGMAGVMVRPPRDPAFGQDIIMRSNGGEECRAVLYVDGMPVDVRGIGGIMLDDFAQPDMVAAIEVYNRPSMVPAEYLTMHRDCGVVALWTKLATGNIAILPPKSARAGRPR